jgi:4-hydroxy-tetrahydrodipicolinate synthase
MLTGIIPPVVTPCHADESVNHAALREHIDWQLSHGVAGIFVLGTTGEFYALSEAEKQAVMVTAVEHVAGRVPVYVGTGAESTSEVLRLSRMAATEGAQGVSVITPYFLKPTQHELYDHFRFIAEESGLPVILYNNPSTCGGLSIESPTVERLAELPGIIGIIDSSGDLQNTINLVERTRGQDFSVLIGRDTLILAGLYFGIHGAIPATCNLAPHLCTGIYQSFQACDFPRAHQLQEQLSPVRLAVSLGTGNAAIKEALKLMGRDCGPNRRPIAPFGETQIQQLMAALRTGGILTC